MKAVILCGGLGTRLRPLTNTLPKPMIDIGGMPVLEHLVMLCKKHNIYEIYFAAYYLYEVIEQYFGSGEKWGVKIKLNVEDPQMGSAGGIKLLEQYLNEPFVVLNGDVMTTLNITNMYQFHQEKQGLATFIVHESSHPYDSELIDVDENWRVKGFLPPPKPGKIFKNITKSGTVILEPEVMQYVPENTVYSIEKELLPDIIDRNLPVYAYYSNEYSHDMGTPERLEKVRADYQEGLISM